MPDDDMKKMHEDADLKATGLYGLPSGAKNAKDGFRNHALLNSDAGSTHSIGIKPHPHNLAIANSLLGRDKIETVQLDESRPLIDLLQEATFGDSVTMQYVEDKYALRMILRKAHCFRLDSETSAMVVDFGLAAAPDLEAVRHIAIPPFPITWFEIDNIARLKRCKERGLQLTETASRDDVCRRVGWLIHPANDLHVGGYYATYCTIVGQGVMISPLSFFWHNGDHDKMEEDKAPNWSSGDHEIQRVCFGTHQSNVGRTDAFPCTTPFHLFHKQESRHGKTVKGLMYELQGELRSIWGLLLALGAGHLGAATVHTPQPLPAGPHPVAKGKPLLPLEHKVLTIKLGKRKTVEKIAAMAITGVKKRWHEVRGHFRTKLNADGTVKWRIPIKPHERGDERLGRIEKTYRVEK